MNTKKEYILCAAVKKNKLFDYPHIYNENDIFKVELGYRHPDILIKYKGSVSEDPKDQGFFTSRGRFVNRNDALKIARECGQVKEIIGKFLTSEDLY